METSFLQKGRSRVHPCDFVENGLHHTDYLAWVLQVTSFSYFGKLSVRYHYYSFYNSLKMACLEYVVYRTFSSKDDFHCVTTMSIFECRCRCRYQCRDADAEVSKLPFTDSSGTTYFVELLNGYFLTFKDKDLLCLYEFFTIFTVIKILAIFGTTWKMLNAILLWSCVGFAFLSF